MININIYRSIRLSDLTDREIKELVKDSLQKLSSSKNIELEILFVDKEKIRELNNKYRKIDKVTDVLSFPQDQFGLKKINILGSIAICPEIAEERKEPLLELIKHGILHLCSYDHEVNEDEWNEGAKLINCKF